jgi:hypothetical protein
MDWRSFFLGMAAFPVFFLSGAAIACVTSRRWGSGCEFAVFKWTRMARPPTSNTVN